MGQGGTSWALPLGQSEVGIEQLWLEQEGRYELRSAPPPKGFSTFRLGWGLELDLVA
jgi:hypothetical protein